MEEITKFSGTEKNYKKYFREDQMKEAIDVALDTRKFEIDLYWKRAAYYWTFIAATFAAYFVLHRFASTEYTLLFIVSCIGLTFSVAWYLANRGSKFWINNWEVQVEYLENTTIGPLYKTVAGSENFRFWKLLTAYPYSVAKINQIVNIYVAGIWLFFAIHSLSMEASWKEPFKNFNFVLVGFFTIFIIILLLCATKTNFKGRQRMDFTQRNLPSDKKMEQHERKHLTSKCS